MIIAILLWINQVAHNIKMTNPKSKIIAIGIILLIISCKTYTIPADSFRSQMINANSENMKVVEINNPLTFGKITYSSNNIKSLVVIDKNGNVGFYSWNFSISADKEFLFGIGRNINEIMQMQSELAELNKNKDILFSVISHDLRNPFQSLIGLSELLLDAKDIEDKEYPIYQASEKVEKAYKKDMKNKKNSELVEGSLEEYFANEK